MFKLICDLISLFFRSLLHGVSLNSSSPTSSPKPILSNVSAEFDANESGSISSSPADCKSFSYPLHSLVVIVLPPLSHAIHIENVASLNNGEENLVEELSFW